MIRLIKSLFGARIRSREEVRMLIAEDSRRNILSSIIIRVY